MPVEILTTIYSQHTIHLQRIGATEGLKVTPFLVAIENDVVSYGVFIFQNKTPTTAIHQ